MKVYKSIVSLPYIIFMIVLGALILLFFNLRNPNVPFSLFVICIFLLIILNGFYSNYIIKGNSLIVKYGVLSTNIINVLSIRKAVKTKYKIGSPATSFSAIQLHYNKSSSMLVSPKNSDQFLQDLKELNPNIELVNFNN